MQSHRTLLIAALTIALAAPARRQHDHGAQKIDEAKSHMMSAMMGTPAFDRSVDGLKVERINDMAWWAIST